MSDKYNGYIKQLKITVTKHLSIYYFEYCFCYLSVFVNNQCKQTSNITLFEIFTFKFWTFMGQLYNILMHTHLLRSFALHAAVATTYSPVWVRVLCFLSLIIPLWTGLTAGSKTKQTSDQYILATTPSEVFFKIWSVIYLLETFVLAYGLFDDSWVTQIWIYFAIINISCGVWAFAFNSGRIQGVDFSVVCHIVNLVFGQLIWIQLGDPYKTSLVGSTMGTIIRNMVAFFNGWFIAAGALGLFIVLVYNFGMASKTQLVLFWIVTPLIYVAFLIYNISVAPFVDSIGLVVSMSWAVIGAAMASCK